MNKNVLLALEAELNTYLSSKISINNVADVIKLQEEFKIQILPTGRTTTFCSLVFPTRPKVESYCNLTGTLECIILGYKQNPPEEIS